MCKKKRKEKKWNEKKKVYKKAYNKAEILFTKIRYRRQALKHTKVNTQ